MAPRRRWSGRHTSFLGRDRGRQDRGAPRSRCPTRCLGRRAVASRRALELARRRASQDLRRPGRLSASTATRVWVSRPGSHHRHKRLTAALADADKHRAPDVDLASRGGVDGHLPAVGADRVRTRLRRSSTEGRIVPGAALPRQPRDRRACPPPSRASLESTPCSRTLQTAATLVGAPLTPTAPAGTSFRARVCR